MTPNAEKNKLKIVQRVFNQLFETTLNTRLEFGFEEPFYLASNQEGRSVIQSRYDYLSSALHEIAHWCIAGDARREVDDYGYWYEPDGRSDQQQALFEKVEVEPQAMEWILSACCQHEFNFSADNLEGDVTLSEAFTEAVTAKVAEFWQEGLSKRSDMLVRALSEQFYDRDCQLPLSLDIIYAYLKDSAPLSKSILQLSSNIEAKFV
ncbi:MAG: elongation factor P hydroxylase [Gammaproteobacteria bacterium]|nr:elongation factor P hydroxylase [Gammaproteobacteria bacterium]